MTNIRRVVELAVVWRSYILVMDLVCELTNKRWLISIASWVVDLALELLSGNRIVGMNKLIF